jgi:hypothetical protein
MNRDTNTHAPKNNPNGNGRRSFSMIVGVILIGIGTLFMLGQYLNTKWLYLSIVPLIGLVMIGSGIAYRKLGFLIPGSLLFGLGIGILFYFDQRYDDLIQIRVGFILLGFSFGWVLIALLSKLFLSRMAWWALIPATLIAALSICFLFTPMRLIDFVFFLTATTALIFLYIGAATKMLGFIIPGGILLGIGPGLFIAWGTSIEINPLSKTGLMLVYFSIGWFIISLAARILKNKFLWWPIIPGGVIAMTGFGLYLGGNPNNATTFISNAGSITLIIFGLYLLLWRKGIHP